MVFCKFCGRRRVNEANEFKMARAQGRQQTSSVEVHMITYETKLLVPLVHTRRSNDFLMHLVQPNGNTRNEIASGRIEVITRNYIAKTVCFFC